ncbi:MAG: type I methionyl aminopeptidase [Erysipelotrichaceae bacterium]|nr:type I methionyl aminopeptidase [Erysipelotrichaceae bacterium]
MVILRTDKEIKLLREAGRIVALTHEELKKHIKPGISTLELDLIAEKTIRKYNAKPSFKGLYGFPGSVCISVNEEILHGIPSKTKILKEGDIVTIDIGACYKGYHGDSAWTYPVGEISEEAKRLLRINEEALYKGLEQALPGKRLGDIGFAISNHVLENGYTMTKDYTGHGVGREVHEDPVVPNYGNAGKGMLLKPGLVIAVEPMVNQGREELRTLDNDWTVVTVDGKLSAHFEHTIAITDKGYIILTTL